MTRTNARQLAVQLSFALSAGSDLSPEDFLQEEYFSALPLELVNIFNFLSDNSCILSIPIFILILFSAETKVLFPFSQDIKIQSKSSV